jgi:hypothetical protein
MDLEDCYKKGYIKKTFVNKELIKSLIEMSDNHEKVVLSIVLNKENISSYVSLAYDSLREVLEAVCISNGYKVTSHICLGELSRNLIENFRFDDFDRFRYIRNGISYYGTQIDLNQGKEIIKKMFEMKKIILNQIKLREI